MIAIDTPDRIYAELFEAVQTGRVFADSKTFADAIARRTPERILEAYRNARQQPGFELAAFIAEHFDLPDPGQESWIGDPRRPIREQIEALWDLLSRGPDENHRYSSLIPLPRSYVVPGGRFREVYYWDSYFTMLGLAASGRVQLLENMVENFAYLIDQIGFVPNGNRTYYCTRSQPPLFVLMVELLAEVRRDPGVVAAYLPQLRREYAFWMSGADGLAPGQATRRVLAVDGGFLNRYWDDADAPRQESFREDLELARQSGRDPSSLFRNVRAGCESGWDFSSRWLADGQSMASIRTTEVLPVDLNAILCRLESVLAREFGRRGERAHAEELEQRARHRRELIQSWFFDARAGFFMDLLLPDLDRSPVQSLAAAFPLFLEIATPEQARAVTDRIHRGFLRPGGWVTTLQRSGQQWDVPNGWAPLQWVVFVGMRNYGFREQAAAGARRWVGNNLSVYQSTGRLLEKYDVEEIGRSAGGGEYGVQSGFGWTNAVLWSFLQELRL